MKILILTNKIKNKTVMLEGLNLAKTWASTIGIDFEYSFKDTSKQFTTVSYKEKIIDNEGKEKEIQRIMVNPQEILDEVDASYKIVCLLHNVDYTTNPFQNPILKNGCNPIQIPENWWVTFPEVLAQYLLHEIAHSGYFFANNVVGDRTHNQGKTIGWENKQPQEYYLWLLQDLKQYLETVSPVVVPVTPTPKKNIVLRRGSTGEAVRQLQRDLKALGYFKYPSITPNYGPVTETAVRAFQTATGLVSDGIVGKKTLQKIEALKKKLK